MCYTEGQLAHNIIIQFYLSLTGKKQWPNQNHAYVTCKNFNREARKIASVLCVVLTTWHAQYCRLSNHQDCSPGCLQLRAWTSGLHRAPFPQARRARSSGSGSLHLPGCCRPGRTKRRPSMSQVPAPDAVSGACRRSANLPTSRRSPTKWRDRRTRRHGPCCYQLLTNQRQCH